MVRQGRQLSPVGRLQRERRLEMENGLSAIRRYFRRERFSIRRRLPPQVPACMGSTLFPEITRSEFVVNLRVDDKSGRKRAGRRHI